MWYRETNKGEIMMRAIDACFYYAQKPVDHTCKHVTNQLEATFLSIKGLSNLVIRYLFSKNTLKAMN